MDYKQMYLDMKSRGESHSSIAAATGLPRSTVSGILNGRRKSPQFEVATKIIAHHKRVMRRKIEPKRSRKA